MIWRRLSLCLALVGLVALAVPAAAAPGIVNASVNGSVFTAHVKLLVLLEADLTISFEDVQNLTVASLGVSAEVINPLDPVFLARLPAGGLVGIPVALPVLIKVSPPVGGGLEFTGVATFSLYTHLLNFSPTLPLRLFSAEPGGPFTEVSADSGPGSLRVGSLEPEYSNGSSQSREYAVMVDNRQASSVTANKLFGLEAILTQAASAIPDGVEADLVARLEAVRDAYEEDDIALAIEELDGLSAAVVEASGNGIPNRWRASGGVTNYAGRLRAGAATLRYSLLGASGAP